MRNWKTTDGRSSHGIFHSGGMMDRNSNNTFSEPTDAATKVSRERRLDDQPTLRPDCLINRRPHFRRSANALYFIASGESCRCLSDSEVAFWESIAEPQSVRALQEVYGSQADSLIREFVQNEFCELIEPTIPNNRRRVLVIEPHADDAALSIGGVMWIRRHECVFVVATMASRSNYTLYHELDLDYFDVDEVTELRRRESELFARMIGGDHLCVGLTDAALRYRDAHWTLDFFRRHRLSVRAATGRIADDRERRQWSHAVRRLLADVASTEVWFPLGGPHVDHLLTSDACCEVFQSDPTLVAGRTFRVYHDVPYLARYFRWMSDAVEAWRDAGAIMERELIPIDEVFEKKLRLASVYASQNTAAMRADIEASARAYAPTVAHAEVLWTLRTLPTHFRPSAIMATKMARLEQQETITDWVSNYEDADAVRILLLTPTGRWAADLQILCRGFPQARFEVYAAKAAAAEVSDAQSDRVRVQRVMTGLLAWISLSLRFTLTKRASPTVFIVGRRRLREARMLSGLWLASDTLVLASMDSLLGALAARRDSTSGGALIGRRRISHARFSVHELDLSDGQRMDVRASVKCVTGVVVIGRNEGERLRRCLLSELCDAELVVYVDSGSEDGSVNLARSLGAEVVELDPVTPFTAGRARNEGYKRLRELRAVTFVQFVDGDCEMRAGWLTKGREFLSEHEDVAAVAGRLREKHQKHSIYNTLCDIEWDAPIGEARSCGGTAMFRASAFERAGGFRRDLIAGEELELCIRLRALGWRVWRVGHEMAFHDSAMSRFGQWWKRSLRAGHAFAQGAGTRDAAGGRYYVRESRSALFWALGVPLLATVLFTLIGPVGLVTLAIYPIQVARLALRGARSTGANWLYAVFTMIGKFPEMLGELRYFVRRRLGREYRPIEYK